MKKKSSSLITRRQAIVSLATITAGTLFKPSSVFANELASSKTRFAVMGDWGTGNSDCIGLAKQMYETHQRTPLDLVLGAGDNIYPNGSSRYFAKNFEQPFANLIKDEVKFYMALGNHDVESGRQDQNHYPLFNMSGSNYYIISRGNGLVDFFMLDTTDFDNTQTSWLENSLRSSKALWKIAVFHHPIYSSGKKHGSNMRLRKQLEPLFTRYGVQVAFSGHDHIYERTKPQNGIQYFVTGAGGKTRRGDIHLNSEFRAMSYDQDNQFMLVEVDEKEIAFKTICETGELIDSGILKQVL
jgi:predicted MPP superfamily phosphohydrolase